MQVLPTKLKKLFIAGVLATNSLLGVSSATAQTTNTSTTTASSTSQPSQDTVNTFMRLQNNGNGFVAVFNLNASSQQMATSKHAAKVITKTLGEVEAELGQLESSSNLNPNYKAQSRFELNRARSALQNAR